MSSFRSDCEKLHLHPRSVSELSDRRVLACPSDVLGRGSEWIECTRSEDELPSDEWYLFSQSFEWNEQHCVHHQLFELDGFRWDQRLFVLQSVAPPSLGRKAMIDLLVWTTDRSTRSLVGFSLSPSIDVRLAASDSTVTLVYLSARVRDQYGCSVEFDIPPVFITRDTMIIASLINALQSVSNQASAANLLNSNELVQVLVNGNQNEVNQVLVSISQMLNTMGSDALQTLLMSVGSIPATALSVSSLDRPSTTVSDADIMVFFLLITHGSSPRRRTLHLR